MIIGTYNMPTFAMKNRQEVENSTIAGCFHCCVLFRPELIKEFTDNDKTCLCPYCSMDTVVGDMGLPKELSLQKLEQARFYWFNTKDHRSQS